MLKDIDVDIPIEIVKPHEDAESETTADIYRFYRLFICKSK